MTEVERRHYNELHTVLSLMYRKGYPKWMGDAVWWMIKELEAQPYNPSY